MPFELRPDPAPTLRPEDDYLQSAWRDSVYPLAERLGIQIRLPAVSPQPRTRLAFEGLQYAREHGKANEYNHAVFVAFFQQSRDIGNPDVLGEIAGAIGLDTPDFRAALESGIYREAHRKALTQAHAFMISAVPTMFIGHRRLQGLYPADAIATVVDEELKREKTVH
jgi:predicted DsbA family dithiol-disulfide isomerase